MNTSDPDSALDQDCNDATRGPHEIESGCANLNTGRIDRRYLVVGCKPWSRTIFDRVICGYPGVWQFLGTREELTLKRVREADPRYIFFLHWSWKVPKAILEKYECVCFHMTDVPYGRGGSPLQNLIARGHTATQLTALRMVEDFDAGPVYRKEALCLSGNAEEIYMRASRISARMIRHIIDTDPLPVPQSGEVEIFKRRKPEQSELPKDSSLESAYDLIRMLDADGYPKAFLEWGGLRFEFQRASLYNSRIVADVTITQIKDESP